MKKANEIKECKFKYKICFFQSPFFPQATTNIPITSIVERPLHVKCEWTTNIVVSAKNEDAANWKQRLARARASCVLLWEWVQPDRRAQATLPNQSPSRHARACLCASVGRWFDHEECRAPSTAFAAQRSRRERAAWLPYHCATARAHQWHETEKICLNR